MAHEIKLALASPELSHIEKLREKLRDAEETLAAIHAGAVDAVVVQGPRGRQIYTLKGADEPYRVLVETMNEGAVTLNEQGLVLYANKRLAHLAGRPLERVLGHRFASLLAPEDAQGFKSLLESGRAGKRTLKLKGAAGPVPVQVSLTPLDLDGERAFCAVVTDLTEAFAVRQAMLQKDAGLRLVAEAAPAILFTLDSRGKLQSCAGSGLKTIGGEIQALLEAPLAGLRKTSSKLMVRQAVRAGRVSYDAQFAGRLWNVNLERLGLGGVIGVAVDVTGDRQQRAMRDAVEREERQREFVANVSHEFRTPLAAIQGYAETLLRGALADKKNAKPFVETIQRQAARLSDLVENMLYLSTMESGKLQPVARPIDVDRLMRDLVKDLRPLAARRNVAMTVSGTTGVKARADVAQMRRVLMNVAANGIKYNKPGGRLDISAACQNGKVTLAFADTGIGIKTAELPRIFERFHRSKDARARTIKGTGLGLSIAKALVESNRGRIWAERNPSRGATFRVQIPASR